MMIERPNWVGNTHSCRRWPAWPNGASKVKPSPVPNPSREIEKLWTRTWDMAASEALGVCDMNWLTLTPSEARPPVPEVPHGGTQSRRSKAGRCSAVKHCCCTCEQG